MSYVSESPLGTFLTAGSVPVGKCTTRALLTKHRGAVIEIARLAFSARGIRTGQIFPGLALLTFRGTSNGIQARWAFLASGCPFTAVHAWWTVRTFFGAAPSPERVEGTSAAIPAHVRAIRSPEGSWRAGLTDARLPGEAQGTFFCGNA